MSVLSFFTWCENSSVGEAIRGSRWLFPVIESFHLLGLAVIGGAVLVVNLRLLGFGMERQPVPQLWRDTRPWLLGSLTIMLVSGLLLFTSEATKLYYHEAFWVKMVSLLLATAFTFTVLRKVALAEQGRVRPFWSKAVALISILLWSGVGVGGRWIGFS
ncbi:MAG TPA: DUF6644 family protein [Candidatus Acidoferrales bacterium]|nr:DUF6644 family protein [Candidatus Acidoferrales bacterium]